MEQRMNLALLLRKPRIFICIALAFIISGCGSTDNNEFGVSGTLVSSSALPAGKSTLSGFPMDDVSIAVKGTNDSGSTDASGNFSFGAIFTGINMTLTISRSDFSTTLEIDNIPSNAKDVILGLVLDPATKTVTAQSVEFLPAGTTSIVQPGTGSGNPGPTAAPGSPTPIPGSKPTSKPPTQNPAIARGKAVFNSKCSSCHSASSLRRKSASQINGAGMPPSGKLSGSNMSDLVAYLGSL